MVSVGSGQLERELVGARQLWRVLLKFELDPPARSRQTGGGCSLERLTSRVVILAGSVQKN